ncbi:MAG: peptidylprolyl isomerase [Clostridiales bacterium]|nr:peptidylprolyl isomerase [Clostridiales bacterium]
MDLNKKKRLILAAAVLFAAIAVGVAVVVALTGSGANEGGQPMIGPSGQPVATDYVAIEVEGYGTITAELYGDMAPITVKNFLKLVDEKFYDGLTFHRIISGFMIQGGCPLGTGMGGTEPIKGEFAQNGVANPLKHERGVLSMARTAVDMNSASSQFFIMQQAAPSLDGGYAGFGKVIDGIEIVDALSRFSVIGDRNGILAAENQPVITSIRRIEKP